MSSLQLQRQDHEGDIGSDAQRGQDDDDIATGAEPLLPDAVGADLVEELAIALLATVGADEEHAGAVDGEQGADGVELGGEDLEHDEREGELRERRADVRALEGALCRAHFDQLVVGEVDRARAVQAQAELVFGVARLQRARQTPGQSILIHGSVVAMETVRMGTGGLSLR